MERGFDPAREYLKTQHLEAEYECRTAHKAIKRGAESYNEYERYEEELEQLNESQSNADDTAVSTVQAAVSRGPEARSTEFAK